MPVQFWCTRVHTRIILKLRAKLTVYQGVNMENRFEDILFDTVNSIVEHTRIGRTKAVTKLYRNGKLAAVRTITAEGTTYAFKGDN